jgi:3-oxoadipate enol-lactonase
MMSFIEVNGVGLRYDLTGAGASTVVLIHEMGGTLESFDDVVPILATTRQILRYDTRGAGLSEKVRGTLTFATMADDLVALLDALGIGDKVALAGVAVGGGIALATAARFPDRVAAVVAGSPATAIGAERRPGVLARVDALERDGMRRVAEASHESGYPVELRADMARFEAFRARWLGNDPASYATIYRMLANSDLEQSLPSIACPVLLIGGTYDRTRPPAAVEPLVNVIPGARYTRIDTGHYMAAQTPELVAKTIGDFLDAVKV